MSSRQSPQLFEPHDEQGTIRLTCPQLTSVGAPIPGMVVVLDQEKTVTRPTPEVYLIRRTKITRMVTMLEEADSTFVASSVEAQNLDKREPVFPCQRSIGKFRSQSGHERHTCELYLFSRNCP